MLNSLNRRNQLQLMALLTAVVVLPTVSLLWFMSRVVANERLVIEQKVSMLYRDKLKVAVDQAELRTNSRLEALSKTDWTSDPYGLLQRSVLKEGFQGVVIWGEDGRRVYPSIGPFPLPNDRVNQESLDQAWQLEFVAGNYAGALERYRALSDLTDPRGLAGQVRCLAKMGRWGEATAAAMSQQSASAAPARLLLLGLLQKEEGTVDRQEMMLRLVNALEKDLFKSGHEEVSPGSLEQSIDYLPTEQNLIIARKLMNILGFIEVSGKEALMDRLSRLADAEQVSLATAQVFTQPSGPLEAMVPVDLGGQKFFVIRQPVPLGEALLVLSKEGLVSALEECRAAFSDDKVTFRILDAQGGVIAGNAQEDEKSALLTVSVPLPGIFSNGRIELSFADDDIFKQAAQRQIAVYVWASVLVILLMSVVGVFALHAMSRQMRLNKMKNDFIATVSHELRTPLASMRLLVDTLLEKRVRDEEHAQQYLQLIARQNERLSRMIENFLTFSRMERNKNAFTMDMISPSTIADDAVDSICTKFVTNNCELKTSLAEELPDIPADHDAMVTVLINLLDNACKYTTENKQIGLAVFNEDDEVCFAVSDNGVGLSRWQIRKIFDSFYQVDHTLARSVEGCGLGLSIVQFIVNAHKGRIEVESEPRQGSTFTVRLPINRKAEH